MATRRKGQNGDASTRDQWLASMPDSYTDCRDLGHTWRPHAGGWDERSRSWERVLRCVRCKTERVQVIAGSGYVVSNHYRYADGYQKPAGADPVSRDQFRVAALTRQASKWAPKQGK